MKKLMNWWEKQRRFKLGQQVRVTVDNCDRIMRTIDFTLADSDEN